MFSTHLVVFWCLLSVWRFHKSKLEQLGSISSWHVYWRSKKKNWNRSRGSQPIKPYFRFSNLQKEESDFKCILYFMVLDTLVCWSFTGTDFIGQRLKKARNLNVCPYFKYKKVNLSKAGEGKRDPVPFQ